MNAHQTRSFLEIRNLSVRYPSRQGVLDRALAHTQVLRNVSLSVGKREIFGIVGESGCGKTTLAKALVGLAPAEGSALFNGIEIVNAGPADRRYLRRRIQIVFQDPSSSLNPRRRIWKIVTEPLAIQAGMRPRELRSRAADLLRKVGLDPLHLGRFPRQLSGGQRQRVAIARALAVEPQLIIMDEPTSALDVSVQARILNLLLDLKSRHDLSYILISHDISVVQHICDRIAVMDRGRVVEVGDAENLLREPKDEYTRLLLRSVPSI